MGLYWGGLIIGRIFASEIWGLIFGRAYFFFVGGGGGGGLLSEFYGIWIMSGLFFEEMKREAEIWRRSADRLLVVSAEEKTVKLLLMQKVMALENTIRNMKRTT